MGSVLVESLVLIWMCLNDFQVTEFRSFIITSCTGVGKSSLVHLICYNNVLSNPSTTIGCSVEVKLHDHHKDSSPQTHFIEFWDVGGSPAYSNGRTVFYNQIHGERTVACRGNCKSLFVYTKLSLAGILYSSTYSQLLIIKLSIAS